MATTLKSETKGVMTLDELKRSPEYAECSDKMKRWLVTLIENGFDYTAATATAFTCKYPEKFSHSVRKWPAIRVALNRYLGRSEQDVFLADLQETIRRAPKGSDRHVRALALYARMRFGVDTPGGEAEPQAPAATNKSEAPAKSKVVTDSRVPVGATALADKQGVIRGYRTPDGQYVQLADVEVGR